MGRSSWTSVGYDLLPRLKYRNPEERIWNFDFPAAAKMFNTTTTLWNSAA